MFTLLAGVVSTGAGTTVAVAAVMAGKTDPSCPDFENATLVDVIGRHASDTHEVLSGAANSEFGRTVLLTWLVLLGLGVGLILLRALLLGSSVWPAPGSFTPSQIAAMVDKGRDPTALARILRNKDVYAERLAKALQCKTVSYDLTSDLSAGDPSPRASSAARPTTFPDENSFTPSEGSNGTAVPQEGQQQQQQSEGRDMSEFDKLLKLMQDSFPLVHEHLERTVVNRHSLVFKWEAGKSKSKSPPPPPPPSAFSSSSSSPSSSSPEGAAPKLAPYLVYAHLDVVPEGDPAAWKFPPFQGTIADGYVWGRGAIDDKQAVFGHLEALEDLLAEGFAPSRDIYLALGHDEELSGLQGAAKIAEHFQSIGVPKFEFMLDEGLFVISDVVPGHKKPVALICTAEKGYVTVKLSASAPPGHSSQPPTLSAKSGSPVGILANALRKLESTPMNAHFDNADAMLSSLAGGFRWPLQVLMSNTWLFSPLLLRVFASKPSTSTLVRTTTALTVVRGGEKSNVLPATATALVNHRIHPKDSVDKVLAHDVKTINDKRVSVEVYRSPVEPSPVSKVDHPAFSDLRASVLEVFPDVAVAPGLFVAASDSRHFWDLADEIYRFNPITLHASETSMFHGDNERIGVRNYAQCVAFFRTFHVRSQNR